MKMNGDNVKRLRKVSGIILALFFAILGLTEGSFR